MTNSSKSISTTLWTLHIHERETALNDIIKKLNAQLQSASELARISMDEVDIMKGKNKKLRAQVKELKEVASSLTSEVDEWAPLSLTLESPDLISKNMYTSSDDIIKTLVSRISDGDIEVISAMSILHGLGIEVPKNSIAITVTMDNVPFAYGLCQRLLEETHIKEYVVEMISGVYVYGDEEVQNGLTSCLPTADITISVDDDISDRSDI